MKHSKNESSSKLDNKCGEQSLLRILDPKLFENFIIYYYFFIFLVF